ncbi:spore coat protein, partial [Bacillus cereus]|nr:spore coat protein [Bacillus cereus]
SGREMGVTFTYKVQDEAGGIAQALDLAEQFVGDDQMVVILGDNVFEDDIAPFVDNFRNQTTGANILLQQVQDPHRFGVAELQGERI